ncbi:MAG: hypothetical protein K2N85_14480 [Lachnospiraceae bacterium]|nr:hypothetical protein [Lachnospiraceae bacterium]
MQKYMKIIRKFFCLPPIPTILISIPSFVLVIYVLTNDMENMAVSYAAYILSAYALIITITGIAGIVRLIRQGINKHPLVKKALDNPLVGRYLKEDMFRAEAALYQGFFINLLYVGIKMFSGIFYRSVWFVTLAVYYILLAVMRASLLHYVRRDRKNKISEWKRYRLCGIILLFMNMALTGIIVLVIHQNSGFVYPGILIYAMAMYAFSATSTAVWNVVKFSRYGSPVMSAAKVISLTAALVSMLSLEIAMLTQFGSDDDLMFRRIMTASTGAGISIIVLGMAVFMIWRSTKQLKQSKQEKEI